MGACRPRIRGLRGLLVLSNKLILGAIVISLCGKTNLCFFVAEAGIFLGRM